MRQAAEGELIAQDELVGIASIACSPAGIADIRVSFARVVAHGTLRKSLIQSSCQGVSATVKGMFAACLTQPCTTFQTRCKKTGICRN